MPFRPPCLAVLALLVAGSAAAQTAPADILPLDQGNRWTYLGSAWSWSPTAGSSSSYLGAQEWLVDGTVEVEGETLPLLRIGTTAVCAVGTEVDGDVISFPFYGPDGTGPCPVDGFVYADGSGERTGIQVDLRLAEAIETEIGGRPYGALETANGIYDPAGCGSLCDGTYQVAVGPGVLSYGFVDDFGPGSRGESWALRRADLGDTAYGSPLDPGDGFFPLAVGDAWTFSITARADDGTPTPSGFVLWTVVGDAAAPVLRVERVLDGVRTPIGGCVATTQAASAANGYRQETRLEDAPDAACPRSLPFALPALDASGLFADGDGQPGVSVATFLEDETVSVGAQAVTADHAQGAAGNVFSPSGPLYRTQWSVGRDLGVLAFAASAEGPGTDSEAWTATLEYALVGGIAYGANPVADEAEAPGEVALALTVGPNPARGAARLTLSGEAPARIAVLDALGRVVARRDAAPGTLELDTSGWAAGAYAVRAESGGEVAWARLTVVR